MSQRDREKKFKNLPKKFEIEIQKFGTQYCTSGIWHGCAKISSRSDKNWGTSSIFSEFILKFFWNRDISKISTFYKLFSYCTYILLYNKVLIFCEFHLEYIRAIKMEIGMLTGQKILPELQSVGNLKFPDEMGVFAL